MNLSVRPGECLVVGGPSGSGKSTLLGLIAGLLPAWGGRVTGEVLVAGVPVDRISTEDRARLLGFYQQAPAGQFLHHTVREDCGFAAENLGWEPARIRRAVAESLERFGVSALADRRPHELSGGEQALVLLASLWMLKPRILLLDEPLAHLDAAHARRLVDALADLKREGCTLVVCEHREDLLGALGDRRLYLDAGGLSEAPAHAGFESAPVRRPAGSRSPTPFVELNRLAVGRGGRTLLAGLSAAWHGGELVVVRGPNGAGKSSLLRVLAGLDRAEAGERKVGGPVRLVGQDPLDQLCRSSVAQECALDLAARRRRTRTRDASRDHEDRDRVLAAVGLADELERSGYVLSDGGRRRLTAACGLLAGAPVLLLDEPTSGLDPHSASGVLAAVLDLVDRGALVVCATHDERWVRVPGARLVDLEAYRSEAPSTAPVRTAPQAPVSRGRRDPRWRFVAFLGALVAAGVPWAWPVAAGLIVVTGLSYLPRQGRALATFLRTLALFWVVPGVLLWLLIGPAAALEGVLRLGLLSLVFHRFFLGIDGKALAVALSRWGVPYATGFALIAATALVPVWSHRVRTIHEMLSLRVGARARRPSFRVLGLLLVPTVIQVWQHAAQLAMNLDLRGFRGRPPRGEEPTA